MSTHKRLPWIVLIIAATLIMYAGASSSLYLTMDDPWVYSLGLGPAWLSSHGRFLTYLAYKWLIYENLPSTYWALRGTIVLGYCALAVILWQSFAKSLSGKGAAPALAVLLTLASVPWAVSVTWLTLAIHIPAHLLAIGAWLVIAYSLNKERFCIALLMLVVSLSIYQVSAFLILVPLAFSILTATNENWHTRRYAAIGAIAALILAILIYLVIFFLYLSLDGIEATGRTQSLVNTRTFADLAARFASSQMQLATYYWSGSSENILYTTLWALIAIQVVALGAVCLRLAECRQRIEALMIYAAITLLIMVPILAQGAIDLRSKICLTALLSIGPAALIAHLDKKASIALVGGLAVILSLIGRDNAIGLTHLNREELKFVQESLLGEGETKPALVTVIAPAAYPHQAAFFDRGPTIGHEPSTKITSQYATYNGGAQSIVKFAWHYLGLPGDP
ncbi:hypothetical protein DNX69_25275 [Rhodopseudomonas palustris]|uniref:Uncharacterized protein n=2 Tax=Rhodopseudomonas palustris TaxID=1076 RepID=A0A323UP02_RHOPL|nr:hypothetical protein DNX69_25275 [Rhodopseudomonas palustris]